MPGDTVKIFIGNVGNNTTSDQVQPLFEEYGEVVECDILGNYGFVHMKDKNEANRAIAQLDNYSINGSNLRVELSTGTGYKKTWRRRRKIHGQKRIQCRPGKR